MADSATLDQELSQLLERKTFPPPEEFKNRALVSDRSLYEKADADFVRERTGFAIGGVPPVAHREPPVTFVDADLLRHEEIWAAAGTPNAVFRLTPADLVALTGGQVVTIAERSRAG